jgi:hypothetical protein
MRAEFGAPIVDVVLLPNCCELLHHRRSIGGAIARLFTRDSSESERLLTTTRKVCHVFGEGKGWITSRAGPTRF